MWMAPQTAARTGVKSGRKENMKHECSFSLTVKSSAENLLNEKELAAFESLV